MEINTHKMSMSHDVSTSRPVTYHREMTSLSELYDTDLDDDEHKETKFGTEHSRKARKSYEYLCSHLHVAPQTEVLKNMTGRQLSLRHRELGPKGALTLVGALSENNELESLDLQDNMIGAGGAPYLHLIMRDNYSITHLDLSHNRLGAGGAVAVASILSDNSFITHLNLAGNEFEEMSAKQLSPGIKVNRSVTHLNLSHNEFREGGMLHISSAFVDNSTVEDLNISWNHIRCKGAVTLCRNLVYNRGILELDVSWNGFGYEGALALGELLKKNTTLRCLNSSNNRINWKGALLVASSLRKNSTLQKLMLGRNPLTTTGCMDLIEAVRSKHCKLQQLDLAGVQVIVDFETVAASIKRKRPFEFKHGGIVGTHDVLGERHGVRLTPMQRIVVHIRETATRAKELFRDFDKNVGNKLDHEAFAARLRKAGIQISSWEIPELIQQIEGKASEDSSEEGLINYKKLAKSLREQIHTERIDKHRQQSKEKRLQRYHRMLLNPKLGSSQQHDVTQGTVPGIIQSQTPSRSGSVRSSRSGVCGITTALTFASLDDNLLSRSKLGTPHSLPTKRVMFSRSTTILPPVNDVRSTRAAVKPVSMTASLGDAVTLKRQRRKKKFKS